MKGKKLTLYIVMIAAFTALTFLVTFLLPIPGFFGVGYINFGDAIIFIASCMLGPLGGAVAGGLGSAIADIFAGYAVYAPFTLVIKGVEGFLCGFLYVKVFGKMKHPILARFISMLIAGVWMIIGYFVADWIIYSNVITAATSNFVTGPIQAGVSIVVALIAMPKMIDIFQIRQKQTAAFSEEDGHNKQDEE